MQEKEYELILSEPLLQAFLALALSKSTQTIVNMAKKKHLLLSSVPALRVMKNYEKAKAMITQFLEI